MPLPRTILTVEDRCECCNKPDGLKTCSGCKYVKSVLLVHRTSEIRLKHWHVVGIVHESAKNLTGMYA
jgi:hypothetical protein